MPTCARADVLDIDLKDFYTEFYNMLSFACLERLRAEGTEDRLDAIYPLIIRCVDLLFVQRKPVSQSSSSHSVC